MELFLSGDMGQLKKHERLYMVSEGLNQLG